MIYCLCQYSTCKVKNCKGLGSINIWKQFDPNKFYLYEVKLYPDTLTLINTLPPPFTVLFLESK